MMTVGNRYLQYIATCKGIMGDVPLTGGNVESDTAIVQYSSIKW